MTHIKKLAVFDWNGTLFDDLKETITATNAAFALFDKGPLSKKAYQDSFCFPLLHFYKANGISPDDFLSRHEETAETFLGIYEKEALKASLRPGAIDLLQWLKEHNVHILLLSNHLLENVKISLRRFGITAFFDHLSCNPQYDASFISKMNKEDRLKAYLKEHDVKAADSFIIGDTHEEQDIGHNLGCLSFSITGGCLSETRLRQGNPDYLVHSLEDVVDILSKKWFL